ncbi:MAG: adenylate/guanylate cyclase domain-containing protein [Acidimicrobiia bacterium]|jgi:class 3 adenylate cyclase
MVQVSAELNAVFTRLLRAFEEGDEDAVRSLMSTGEHTLILGTDPREWFRGGEGVELILVQMRGIPDFEYELRRSEAFEHNGVGWVAADVISHVADGPSVELRMSAIFALERPGWRLVHLHTSSPSPDDADRIGPELSATMEDILDSLQAESEARSLRERLKTRTVTLVFTDIEDSTLRTADSGDFAWSQIVGRHFDHVGRIARENSGVVVKTMGDGAMLAFGTAAEAVRAAIEISRAPAAAGEDPMPTRIGVHSGEAVRHAEDYFGRTVNKAARVAAAAQPGQILVSDVVKSLVAESPDITFDAPLSFELKGLPGSQTLYPVRL